MTKILTFLFPFLFFLHSCTEEKTICRGKVRDARLASIDSLAVPLAWPDELLITGFAGPDKVPSPACLSVAATGEVFVGVDMIGSLGKDPGKGKIVRLVDCNNDGVLDSLTEFAQVDNPRGILAMGDKVYVLHSVFSEAGIVTGMDLVVFEDKDRDGVADGPPEPLIEHISTVQSLQKRGTDHATNGIRMGIDGWIYIAVGDFGFHKAVDREGTELTMLGGGIVRVRPNGTEMEVFTHGLRNIYDVSIDPFMNMFTRGNTNDGGGWNIRFSHQIQSGEYGYPMLFQNFTDEIIPALADLGGGSGTGALFMDEPNWPGKYNKVQMMADWGRSELFIHRVTPDQASFKQSVESFIKMPQITDLDVDGSGRLYISAWDGAGYSGDSTKGFISLAVPKGWKYGAFPRTQSLSISKLKSLLSSESAVARLNAQQELLERGGRRAKRASLSVARDEELSLEARVAGLFTYAQLAGEEGVSALIEISRNEDMKEFCLRALSDRKVYAESASLEPFIDALSSSSERIKIASIIGLGRLGKKEATKYLLDVAIPPSFSMPILGEEGAHAAPNAAIIPAHLAVRSLLYLDDPDALVEALRTKNALALWTMRYVHHPKIVNSLIDEYQRSDEKEYKEKILHILSRLYLKEAPYDGEWWWGTRPDTHGPYYRPMTWEASDQIRLFLLEEWEKSSKEEKNFFTSLNRRYRMGIPQFGGMESAIAIIEEKATVDLEKIKSKNGQVGVSSIEDVMIAIEEIKGDATHGKEIFLRQGCGTCHSLNKNEVMKGPYMGQIGSIMNRMQIAESILKPNASISQGFATVLVKTKNQGSTMGFITEVSFERILLRDITGAAHVIAVKDIEKRELLENSVMPEGLANSLSFEVIASLVSFLSKQM